MANGHLYTEFFHRLNREVNVGATFNLSHDGDFACAVKEREGEQKTRYILGAYISRKYEAASPHAPRGLERKASQTVKIASCGDDLVG